MKSPTANTDTFGWDSNWGVLDVVLTLKRTTLRWVGITPSTINSNSATKVGLLDDLGV